MDRAWTCHSHRRSPYAQPRAASRSRVVRGGEPHFGPRGTIRGLAPLLICLAAWMVIGGCNTNPATNSVPTGSPGTSETTADAVLRKLTDAYSAAPAYRDQGTITLSYRQQGERFQDRAPLEVHYERPGRIYLHAYQATVVSDGQQLRARIEDAQTNDLDGQLLVVPAPKTLSLKELYADQVLDDVLRSGLGRYPVQLELLLGDEPLKAFWDTGAKRQLLESSSADGHACQRVAVETPEGRFVLWVDQESGLLRRMEYPADVLKQSLAAGDQVDDVSLVADFADAQFGGKFKDQDFELPMPSQARQVQAFVLPPEPLPTNLYGRRPERFFFTDLDGAAVGQQQMEGHANVLVWFTAHPACQPALEQLDQLRLKMADNPTMRFYAVCTEPSTMSNDRLRELAQKWKIDVPLLRDLEACGRDVFQIPGAPTLVVLDPKGAVQVFEAGTDSALIEQLPEVLRRLDQGQDLAAQLLAAHRIERENYQRLLEAGGGTQATVLEMPKTELRPASQPGHLKLHELWSCDQLTAAGNLLVVPASQPVAAGKATGESDGDPAGGDAVNDRILVLDGFQTVVELSSKGDVWRRTTLQLPPNSAVTYLRSAVDGQGKQYYAAASLRGPQVHLFDQQWNHLLDYPSLDQPHEGVHDCRLADLDADGQLELYAGFWGLVGIHAVDLEGQRKWSNRTATNVLTLAVSTPNAVGWRKLLASSDLGPITRINQFGIDDKPIEVANRAIHHLYAWEGESDGLPPYCGLSYQGPGNMVAVGLAEDFAEQWNYSMPAGTYETEIQFVAPLRLPGGQRAWALAGPDGSVHLVSADGQFSDHFGTGQPLTGIAGTVWQGRPVLLLATSKRITAWELLP